VRSQAGLVPLDLSLTRIGSQIVNSLMRILSHMVGYRYASQKSALSTETMISVINANDKS
jgi:hypothetical protein